MSRASLNRIMKQAERWSDLLHEEQVVVALAWKNIQPWMFGHLRGRGLKSVDALVAAHERVKKDLQELEGAIIQVREDMRRSVPLLRTDALWTDRSLGG